MAWIGYIIIHYEIAQTRLKRSLQIEKAFSIATTTLSYSHVDFTGGSSTRRP